MKKSLLLSLFFLPLGALAGDFSDLANPLERATFQMGYGRTALDALGGGGTKATLDDCVRAYHRAHESWRKTAESSGELLQAQGMMKGTFTRSEIRNMPAANPHGLKGTVRGTDRLEAAPASLGGAPDFPHALPGCENRFDEAMRVTRANGKYCREVRFSLQNHPEATYYQTYCENSSELKINFHPTNRARLSTEDNKQSCVER